MASAQQAEMARMRALETGRMVLLGGNTGITAIINPLGDIVNVIPPHQSGVLNGTVTPMQGNTPLMRWHQFLEF